jgi:hypothetical protein
VIVGRQPELAAIAAALDTARGGHGSALWFEGDAGTGKSALLDAAPDFLVVRAADAEGDLAFGHAGLTDVVRRLHAFLDAVPGPQRRALDEALGRAETTDAARPYLVAAGTLSLLAAAAAARPVLLVIDDLDRVDPESVTALLFAVRRLRHDAVAAAFAGRRPPEGQPLTGLAGHRLSGLADTAVRDLLRAADAEPISDAVAARLAAETGGNPLALTEVLRSLTLQQRRGSAALPDVLPVGAHLDAAFGRALAALAPGTRRALVLTAASDGGAGHVADTLAAEGLDLAGGLADAERSGVLVLRDGRLHFRHPLLRAVVWRSCAPAEQRSAHRSLAGVLPPAPAPGSGTSAARPSGTTRRSPGGCWRSPPRSGTAAATRPPPSSGTSPTSPSRTSSSPGSWRLAEAPAGPSGRGGGRRRPGRPGRGVRRAVPGRLRHRGRGPGAAAGHRRGAPAAR